MITPNYPPKVSSSAENNPKSFSETESRGLSDELISDLAGQTENRRAVQVFEWEKLRRRISRNNLGEFAA